MRSIVDEVRAKVKQQVQLPAGYFIQYRGQFELEQQATQNILVFSAIAFVLIAVLMYLTVKSIPSTAMIMINLLLALVGGVISVPLTGGVISVASLVGFITLFGVVTRNGLLLFDNYNAKFAEGMLFKEAIIQGSMERLNAIWMTAFTPALGLAPLVVGSGAGKKKSPTFSCCCVGRFVYFYEAIFNAITAQIQLPDGTQKSLPLAYDAGGKHYTTLPPEKISGEYNVAILSDISGEKVNGRFTFKR